MGHYLILIESAERGGRADLNPRPAAGKSRGTRATAARVRPVRVPRVTLPGPAVTMLLLVPPTVTRSDSDPESRPARPGGRGSVCASSCRRRSAEVAVVAVRVARVRVLEVAVARLAAARLLEDAHLAVGLRLASAAQA